MQHGYVWIYRRMDTVKNRIIIAKGADCEKQPKPPSYKRKYTER